jgi:hypothetical protein
MITFAYDVARGDGQRVAAHRDLTILDGVVDSHGQVSLTCLSSYNYNLFEVQKE